ncbi:hypothetical protein BDR26DRAFT_837971 [Obelidium mucronatum]|nr:hypothetical protein BDR26DRAFT_837971 [Obelidium mucronatum]
MVVQCRFFLSGNCSKGNDCAFSHLLEAEAIGISQDPPTCRYFNIGFCSKGEQCPFLHVQQASQSLVQNLSSNCIFFQRGSCRYGSLCSKAHNLYEDPVSLITVPISATDQSENTIGEVSWTKTLGAGNIRVTFGLGVVVNMALSLSKVMISGFRDDTTTASVYRALVPLYETDPDVLEVSQPRFSIANQASFIVTFKSKRAAEEFCNTIDSPTKHHFLTPLCSTDIGTSIRAKIQDHKSGIRNNSLKISWQMPSKVAFLHFKNALPTKRLASLIGTQFVANDWPMSAAYQTPNVNQTTSFTIVISGIHPSLTEGVLEGTIRRCFKEEWKSAKFMGMEVNFAKGFDLMVWDASSRLPLHHISQHLRDKNVDGFEMDYVSVKPHSRWQKAVAEFETADMAERAALALNQKVLKAVSGKPIVAEVSFTSRFTLLSSVYAAIKSKIDTLKTDLENERSESKGNSSAAVASYLRIDESSVDSVTALFVSSSNKRLLVRFRHAFNNNLMRGTIILSKKDNRPVWVAKLLSSKAVTVLNRVAISTGGAALVDKKIQCIRVFGSDQRVIDSTITAVLEVIREWTLTEKKVKLTKEDLRALLVCGLEEFKELVVSENLRLDITTMELVADGDELVEDRIRAALNSAAIRKTGNSNDKEEAESICPVCFCDTGDSTNIALSSCGHTYCLSCFRFYTSTFSGPFPLACISQGCNISIVLEDFASLMSVAETDRLMTAAFTSHVSENPSKYRICPTADCLGIFLHSDGSVQQCSECKTSICVLCGFSEHEGFTCAQVASASSADSSFNQWVLL